MEPAGQTFDLGAPGLIFGRVRFVPARILIVAFPIAILSALKSNIFGLFPYLCGLLGLSTPNFMLALILMYISSVFLVSV